MRRKAREILEPHESFRGAEHAAGHASEELHKSTSPSFKRALDRVVPGKSWVPSKLVPLLLISSLFNLHRLFFPADWRFHRFGPESEISLATCYMRPNRVVA